MNYNLAEMLAHRAILMPHQEGFVESNCRLSFEEVNKRCDTIAAWLHANQIKPGERVAILGKNSVAHATMFYGAAKADTISVVLNWRLQEQELTYILKDSGSTVLFYDAEFTPIVEKLVSNTELKFLVCNGANGNGSLFSEIITKDDLPPCPRAQRRDDDAAVLMYTSGTTGKPKAAILTHANFLAAAHGTSSTIDWLDSHRFLLVVPVFHIGGLMPLTTSVQKGTTVYFEPEFDPVNVWQLIAKERITTMMTVPAMAQALLMVAAKIEVDASSLINITCGASVVPQAIISSFKSLNVSVQQVYGLTEVTGAATFWKESMNPQKSTSHGKPVYLLEIVIADLATGNKVESGVHGEILCRGAVVFSGYWNNQEATDVVFQEGWFATGDIGYLDEDGFLYVVDRLKDLIISGGENIYPAEIEQVVASLEGVLEVAVVAQADKEWCEVPIMFVVQKAEANLDTTDILHYCKDQLAHFKCPKEVIILDKLPRNGIGKVLKNKLREMLL